jgi:hypothetical protein
MSVELCTVFVQMDSLDYRDREFGNNLLNPVMNRELKYENVRVVARIPVCLLSIVLEKVWKQNG